MFTTFTFDSFNISNTRSLHNDTDFVKMSVLVGDNPPIFAQKSMGDVNNGTHSVALSIEADIPDDDTIVVFGYTVVNNGHGKNDVVEKAAETALTSIGQEIVKHDVITGTVAVGAIVVPVVGTVLAALAAIVGVTKLLTLIFADCDGWVAGGSMPFKCSDLIKRTQSGQKITVTTDHPGLDSADGCGSNSRYSTTCTMTTAQAIQTVIDIKGAWVTGGVPGPLIAVNGNNFTIDMSYAKRPQATGTVLNSNTISVNFPDDKTYTATLKAPGTIAWSNNSSWTRAAAIATLFDLDGAWMAGGVRGPVFTVRGNSISIDMSYAKRPAASGTITDASHVTVNFPDDKSYTATLQAPGTLHWSNNTSWTKYGQGKIKHLFVLMLENRAFDHMLGFSNIGGTDAETHLATKAEGLTGTESNVYESQTFPVTQTAADRMTTGPDHQFNDVLINLCGPDFDNKNPNGGNYPTVNGTGYAAAYGITNTKAVAGQAMACFAPGELPIINGLANEFVLCDHWFSAMAGPTEPNRMFVHAATSGPWDDSPSSWAQTKAELGLGDISFPTGTIYDRLRAANIPFRIYAGDVFPNVGLLHGISISNDVDDFANFQGDISGPYDAAYTFIEPSYDALTNNFKNGNSQHPLGSVRAGEQLIKQVFESIRQSPLWNDSMLIVCYDEHGGFYDHYLPPRATPTGFRGQSHGYMFDQYGPRVPAIVISPWCPKNLIEHRQLEHSAVPATVEQLFGLSPMTVRDKEYVGLQSLATLAAPRQDALFSLPPVAAAATGEAPATAPDLTTPLDGVNSDWPFWLLRIAVKHHIEAQPANSAAILAQVNAMKTLGDLNQYTTQVAGIITAKQAEARKARVGTRPIVRPIVKPIEGHGPVVAPHPPVIEGHPPIIRPELNKA